MQGIPSKSRRILIHWLLLLQAMTILSSASDLYIAHSTASPGWCGDYINDKEVSTSDSRFIPLGRLSLSPRNDISNRNGASTRRSKTPLNGSHHSENSYLSLDCSSWTEAYNNGNHVLMASTKTKRKPKRFLRIWRKSNPNNQKRVGGTDVHSLETTSPEELAVLSTTTPLLDRETIMIGASQPLIPHDVWNQMTGDEFDDYNVVEALAKTGLHMATKHKDNGWVDWKGSLPSNVDACLESGEILVYTGSTLRSGFGSEVPWIKSISFIPMTPSEIADLMMDSSRVKTYNSLSLGRDDLKLIPPPPSASAAAAAAACTQTKIVRNIVQLPVSNSKVESITLLHTRQLENGAQLLVSRAIAGKKYASDGKVGRSYILLGVNLFEPVPGSADVCRMTAVTHAYSPGVPTMLAGKVGVKSAKNFVRDIRALCVPVSQ